MFRVTGRKVSPKKCLTWTLNIIGSKQNRTSYLYFYFCSIHYKTVWRGVLLSHSNTPPIVLHWTINNRVVKSVLYQIPIHLSPVQLGSQSTNGNIWKCKYQKISKTSRWLFFLSKTLFFSSEHAIVKTVTSKNRRIQILWFKDLWIIRGMILSLYRTHTQGQVHNWLIWNYAIEGGCLHWIK